MGNLTDNAMKYIDAEKLKAEIERHIPQEQGFGDGGEEYGYKCALKDIKRFIDSLQQEMWKPSEEQITAAKSVYSVLKSHDTWGEDEHLPILMSLINDLQKLL